MKYSFFKHIVLPLLLVGCFTVGLSSFREVEKPKNNTLEAFIADWPETSKKIAKTIEDKYGDPDEKTASMLVWHNKGPWKRTIVWRDTVAHHFPMPHPDLLEQVIDYKVPLDKYDDLAMYDGSVIVERTKGEISARCDKEGANMLALNLAHEVATGVRSVKDARAFYAKTIKNFMAGQSSPYMERFLFTVPKGGTADADRSVM